MKRADLPPNPDPVLNQPITPELIKKHGLLPDEYEQIRLHLGGDPTLTELGIFSVMWSEHCSYKNTRPLLKGFPTEKRGATESFGRVLVKAGEENAGIIDVGTDGPSPSRSSPTTTRAQSSPSRVRPPGSGASSATSSRWAQGRCCSPTRSGLASSTRPSTKRLLRGVVAGIAHYGNCVGVPTVAGDVYFDRSYEGNPLVNALCLGTLRHDQIRLGKATGLGNPVYYVGAATGRDGLGGAHSPRRS
jgi:phosphoribosylformylglycinamidine (FGAM) synthase-like enzyme